MTQPPVPGVQTARVLEEFRLALRRVLKWAEAYEPPRDRKRSYDADLDSAEALLAKTDADHPGPRKPMR